MEEVRAAVGRGRMVPRQEEGEPTAEGRGDFVVLVSCAALVLLHASLLVKPSAIVQ